ncbi:hypothetical protein E2C01_009453 [Portunus trituberculatus]|uniref:Uncharacterized protein n=1 Tax=Portunus trituberculatus TaxID=210409 RepID=A0A5B7D5T9_PORTR|nr:hypothetical protein [Portunus trituberculatus]
MPTWPVLRGEITAGADEEEEEEEGEEETRDFYVDGPSVPKYSKCLLHKTPPEHQQQQQAPPPRVARHLSVQLSGAHLSPTHPTTSPGDGLVSERGGRCQHAGPDSRRCLVRVAAAAAAPACVSVKCCTAYQVKGDAQPLQKSEGQCQYGFAAAVVRAAAAAACPEGEQGSDGLLQRHQEVHHLAGDSAVQAGRRRFAFAGTSRRTGHPPCTEGAQGEERRREGRAYFFICTWRVARVVT